MRMCIRSLAAVAFVLAWACEQAMPPTAADGDGKDGERMEARRGFSGTDSRIAVKTNDDGTITAAHIVGNTGYVWMSVEGYPKERVAINDIASYFGRMDPAIAAALQRLEDDPEFRRKMMADDLEATKAMREFIAEYEHREANRR